MGHEADIVSTGEVLPRCSEGLSMEWLTSDKLRLKFLSGVEWPI